MSQARIVAYSDSDSDEPMPSLPFRRRKGEEGSDSDNNADSAAAGADEKKGVLPWRGWGLKEKPVPVRRRSYL